MIPTAPFGGSAEVFRWLDGFINLERGQTKNSFRLDRMETLVRLAGHPERGPTVVHVAGSKGKGSVTVMAASILDAAGLRTARYVSPHVVDYRERLGTARGPFPEATYAAAGDELRGIVEKTLADPENPLPGGEEPTFFELMTLLFFLCARRAESEVLVVETGMGGRLDATNVVDPAISIITPIELEHTEYLGTTVRAIAGEKAGIVKKGRPVIVAEQEDAALEVFRSTAAECSSPLRYLPEVMRVEGVSIDRDGTSARLVCSDPSLFPAPLDIRLSLVGEVQAKNAALAALAVRLAFPAVDDAAIVAGLERSTLPARFERVRNDPPAVIDGAHTARSVRLAADAFGALYGEGGVLLFGCAVGKDVSSMAEILGRRFSRVIITAPGNFKKSDPESAYRAFERLGAPAELMEDTGRAINAALEISAAEGKPLLATGSFYLAAAVRSVLVAATGRS